MGAGWTNIHELGRETQALKRKHRLCRKSFYRQTLQIGRGFVSPHRLCKQTGSVNSDGSSEEMAGFADRSCREISFVIKHRCPRHGEDLETGLGFVGSLVSANTSRLSRKGYAWK